MKLGHGSHRYEIESQWGQLPEGMQFGYTHGIVVDKNNHVYVFHTGTPSIVEFSPNGEFIRAFGEEFVDGAHGFYLHQEADGEYLYVTDTRGSVKKLTMAGDTLLTIETPDLPNVYDADRKFIPTDVAVAPNGDIYVSDGYGQSYVHRYDAAGTYLQSWGGKGSESGQLNCPHGISIDVRRGEPEVYIADRGNHRIQVFTLDGEFKRGFDDDMDMPCSFYFHGDEMVFPDLNSRVTVFDGNDECILHLGEDQQAYKQKGWPNLPKSYYRPNKFSSPHGVCVDSKGNIYVAEWISDGRLTKLNRV